MRRRKRRADSTKGTRREQKRDAKRKSHAMTQMGGATGKRGGNQLNSVPASCPSNHPTTHFTMKSPNIAPLSWPSWCFSTLPPYWRDGPALLPPPHLAPRHRREDGHHRAGRPEDALPVHREGEDHPRGSTLAARMPLVQASIAVIQGADAALTTLAQIEAGVEPAQLPDLTKLSIAEMRQRTTKDIEEGAQHQHCGGHLRDLGHGRPGSGSPGRQGLLQRNDRQDAVQVHRHHRTAWLQCLESAERKTWPNTPTTSTRGRSSRPSERPCWEEALASTTPSRSRRFDRTLAKQHRKGKSLLTR